MTARSSIVPARDRAPGRALRAAQGAARPPGRVEPSGRADDCAASRVVSPGFAASGSRPRRRPPVARRRYRGDGAVAVRAGRTGGRHATCRDATHRDRSALSSGPPGSTLRSDGGRASSAQALAPRPPAPVASWLAVAATAFFGMVGVLLMGGGLDGQGELSTRDDDAGTSLARRPIFQGTVAGHRLVRMIGAGGVGASTRRSTSSRSGGSRSSCCSRITRAPSRCARRPPGGHRALPAAAQEHRRRAQRRHAARRHGLDRHGAPGGRCRSAGSARWSRRRSRGRSTSGSRSPTVGGARPRDRAQGREAGGVFVDRHGEVKLLDLNIAKIQVVGLPSTWPGLVVRRRRTWRRRSAGRAVLAGERCLRAVAGDLRAPGRPLRVRHGPGLSGMPSEGQLVAAHMLRMPVPVHEIVPSIPDFVWSVVQTGLCEAAGQALQARRRGGERCAAPGALPAGRRAGRLAAAPDPGAPGARREHHGPRSPRAVQGAPQPDESRVIVPGPAASAELGGSEDARGGRAFGGAARRTRRMLRARRATARPAPPLGLTRR